MKGEILSIGPDGKHLKISLERAPELDELKAAIGGGYLELVPGFGSLEIDGCVRRCVAFCDEDGKRRALPYNEVATGLWDRALQRNGHGGLVRNGELADYLVGLVAVLFGDDAFMAAL